MSNVIPCPECKGTGGFWRPELGRDVDCLDCEGTGDDACVECGERPAVEPMIHWTDEQGRPRVDTRCAGCHEAAEERAA